MKKNKVKKEKNNKNKGINTGICIKMQHTRRVYD